MAKVDLDLENLTTLEKIAKGRAIVKALTDNPNFPNPEPPLAQLTAAIDELELAYYEAQASERATAEAERVYEERSRAFLELVKDETRH